jgi:hypothetical protein
MTDASMAPLFAVLCASAVTDVEEGFPVLDPILMTSFKIPVYAEIREMGLTSFCG